MNIFQCIIRIAMPTREIQIGPIKMTAATIPSDVTDIHLWHLFDIIRIYFSHSENFMFVIFKSQGLYSRNRFGLPKFCSTKMILQVQRYFLLFFHYEYCLNKIHTFSVFCSTSNGWRIYDKLRRMKNVFSEEMCWWKHSQIEANTF